MEKRNLSRTARENQVPGSSSDGDTGKTPKSEDTAEEDEKEIAERELISPHCEIAKKWYHSVSHNVYDTEPLVEIDINTEIEVLWPQDLAWYCGSVTIVTRSHPEDSLAEIVLLYSTYNDGDQEDIEDINKQRWRMI